MPPHTIRLLSFGRIGPKYFGQVQDIVDGIYKLFITGVATDAAVSALSDHTHTHTHTHTLQTVHDNVVFDAAVSALSDHTHTLTHTHTHSKLFITGVAINAAVGTLSDHDRHGYQHPPLPPGNI